MSHILTWKIRLLEGIDVFEYVSQTCQSIENDDDNDK